MNYIIDLYCPILCPEHCDFCMQQLRKANKLDLNMLIDAIKKKTKTGDDIYIVSEYSNIYYLKRLGFIVYTLCQLFKDNTFHIVSHKKSELYQDMAAYFSNLDWVDCKAFVLQTSKPMPDDIYFKEPYEYLVREAVVSCIGL